MEEHGLTYLKDFKPAEKWSGRLLILLLILLTGCTEPAGKAGQGNEAKPYSFFVAGHTYGGRGMYHRGLHPPFEAKFSLINERGIELGFLTGDIVVEPSEKDWDEVDSVLNYLNAKVYFAPGNHDIRERELYESRYGRTYYSFLHRGDLFIVLDPNIDRWNISGRQKEFLDEVIRSNARQADNIFVFFHQLLWWDKSNKYKKVIPNSTKGMADSINFWVAIEPAFRSLPNEVYMFAGDMGGANWSDFLMYDHYENITFVASGMGSGKGDHFIVAEVSRDTVLLEVVALDDDIHALGKIEDYQVP